ncbi:11452_t:CDS:1, partial [Cetraspora pellucida]
QAITASSQNNSSLYIGIGVVGGILILIVAAMFLWLLRKKRSNALTLANDVTLEDPSGTPAFETFEPYKGTLDSVKTNGTNEHVVLKDEKQDNILLKLYKSNDYKSDEFKKKQSKF